MTLRRTCGTSPGWRRRRPAKTEGFRSCRCRGGLGNGRVRAHPRGPQPHDRLDEADVAVVVAVVTAGQAVRPREPTCLPSCAASPRAPQCAWLVRRWTGRSGTQSQQRTSSPAADIINVLAGVIEGLWLAADVGDCDVQDGVLALRGVTEAISGVANRLGM